MAHARSEKVYGVIGTLGLLIPTLSSEKTMLLIPKLSFNVTSRINQTLEIIIVLLAKPTHLNKLHKPTWLFCGSNSNMASKMAAIIHENLVVLSLEKSNLNKLTE